MQAFSNNTKATITDLYLALRNILQILQRPLYVNSSTGNIKNEVVSGTLTTVTTVTSVTSLSNIGTQDAFNSLIIQPMKIQWALTVRRNIS